MAILFYKLKDPYGCFSNFSRHPILLDNITWPTTEHFFQAQKYIVTSLTNPLDRHRISERYKEIATSATPRIAADLGRDRSIPLRSDWENIKDTIMMIAVMKKLITYPEIMGLLMNTGEEEIIEDSPIDYYWGWGKDHSGRNQLGKTYMELRTYFRKKPLNI